MCESNELNILLRYETEQEAINKDILMELNQYENSAYLLNP